MKKGEKYFIEVKITEELDEDGFLVVVLKSLDGYAMCVRPEELLKKEDIK